MENFKITGVGSPEDKSKVVTRVEQHLENTRQFLSSEDLEKIQDSEQIKGELELAAINFANQATNEMLEKFGITPYNIPTDNYFFVSHDGYVHLTGSEYGIAFARNGRKQCFVDVSQYENNSINLCLSVLHETIHLKSFYKLNVPVLATDKILESREGLVIRESRKLKKEGEVHTHFNGLNEAVVSKLELSLLGRIKQLDILKGEVDRVSQEDVQQIIKDTATDQQIPKDEIFWVSPDGKEYEAIPYRKYREVLDYVCNEISKDLSETYSSPEEVFNEFAKAFFSGNLLIIAKLVENAFGPGSFRILSNMSIDKQSAVLCLETLRKMRARRK
jgi:hypothetical protein